jgi:hypothetical protein
MAGAGRIALYGAGSALAAGSLALAVPGGIDYASRPSPAAQALRDALADDAHPIGMHAVMLRPEQWYHGNASGRVIRRPHGQEVDALVDLWRADPAARVIFIADPRRSDLARLDPRARGLQEVYDWGFDEFPLLGGVRPGALARFRLAPPGWMLDEGWAVTPEIGGQTDRAGAGPHRRPSTAWVRPRQESVTMMLGGRNLVVGSDDEAVVTIQSGERFVASFTAKPGFFFERWDLPAGALAGPGPWLPFTVTATSPHEPGVAVGLEQFDLQPAGVPMVGYLQGWQEPEYEPVSGRTWRWMSERAYLWVRDVGRDVRLELHGESPLRYFDTPPAVSVTIGGRELARFSPDSDFTQVITIPAGDLAKGGQPVVVHSSQSFVPGGDQRNLALRIYSVTVN